MTAHVAKETLSAPVPACLAWPKQPLRVVKSGATAMNRMANRPCRSSRIKEMWEDFAMNFWSKAFNPSAKHHAICSSFCVNAWSFLAKALHQLLKLTQWRGCIGTGTNSPLPSTIPSQLPCAPCFFGASSNCSSAVGPSWSLNKKRKGWKPQFPCTLYNQHPKVAASHPTMTLALAGHLRRGTCYTIFCPNYAIWIWPRFPSLTLPLWPKQPLKWPSQPVLRPKQPQCSGASNHWAKRKREKKISMTLVKISSRASIREMSFYGRRQAENRKAVPQ